MKIDLTRIPDTPDSAPATASAKLAGSESKGAVLSKDTAKLSMGQSTVEALAAKVNEAPEICQEKVAALAKLVRAGSYRTTPEQTAEAMIAHMTLAPAA
jgi:hypothetical protein